MRRTPDPGRPRFARVEEVNAVYGPVRSWRVGSSLGIDLLCLTSICSFNCTYCQLGSIAYKTLGRQVFVPTPKVLADLEVSRWREASIATFSGSGEPTLAANLGECIQAVQERTKLPVLVLTNGTLLGDAQVRRELRHAEQIFVKLDAGDEETFRRVNRPVEGVTLQDVLGGLRLLKEEFSGRLGIQAMFVHSNVDSIKGMCSIVGEIKPAEIQVNTPTRPYPGEWHVESRGSHEGVAYPAYPLKPVEQSRLERLADQLQAACPSAAIRRVGGS